MKQVWINPNELKRYFAHIAYVRFKASASPSDEWYKFTEKEIEDFIDKFVSLQENEDK